MALLLDGWLLPNSPLGGPGGRLLRGADSAVLRLRFAELCRNDVVGAKWLVTGEPMDHGAQEFLHRHADFFRRLMSGEDTDPCWNDWWHVHEAEAESVLSPGQYLRLKLETESELRTILQSLGLRFREAERKWLLRWDDPVRPVQVDYEPVPAAWLEKSLRDEHVGRSDHKLPPDIRALKRLMRAGDEIWSFRSPVESWGMMAGRMGLALVRDGAPIASVTTLIN